MIPPVADLGNLQGLETGMTKPTTMIDDGRFNGAKAYKDSKAIGVHSLFFLNYCYVYINIIYTLYHMIYI